MKITIDLDDDLVEVARNVTGVHDPIALIHTGLRALIERESARRLALLGGTEPKLRSIPRRRAFRA